MARHRLLAGMRTRVVNARIKRDRRSFQRFEGHRAGDIGDAGESFRAEEGEPADGVHRLGAIQEREAFFGLRGRPAEDPPACSASALGMRSPS